MPGFVIDQAFQGLLDLKYKRDAFDQDLIPHFMIPEEIVGIETFSAVIFFFHLKIRGDIQIAIVIGQLLAGFDVPDGDLKLVTGG